MGKFTDTICERLNEIALSGCDETLGDVQDFGWYGLILLTDEDQAEQGYESPAYVLHEDSNGFVDYVAFDSHADASEAWAKLEEEYNEFMGEEGKN